MTAGAALDWGRWVAVAVLVLTAAFFSFLNAGERVTLDVGFTTLYRISLVGLVFGAFLLGMVAMFLFSLAYDRKVRDVLREHEMEREFLRQHSRVLAPRREPQGANLGERHSGLTWPPPRSAGGIARTGGDSVSHQPSPDSRRDDAGHDRAQPADVEPTEITLDGDDETAVARHLPSDDPRNSAAPDR